MELGWRRLDKQMLPGLGWEQATARGRRRSSPRQARSPGVRGTGRGRRLDKPEASKLEVLGGVTATTGPKAKIVTRLSPRQLAEEDGHKRRASASLLPSSICHRESPLARRPSPTRTSQRLFGDRGVRAGARESPGRPPGRLPPPPRPFSAVPGVVAASPLAPPPKAAFGPARGSPPAAF